MTKLILPIYDLSLMNQAIKLLRSDDIAIININSGPNNKISKTWAKYISKLKCSVYGYIDTIKWPNDGWYNVKKKRPITNIELYNELNSWKNWYDIENIFFDDVTEEPYVAHKDDILNFGTIPTIYTEVLSVTHEDNNYIKSKECKAPNQIVFSLGEKDYIKSLTLARKRNVKYIYITSYKDGPSVYNKYPSYIEELAKNIHNK